MSRHARVASMVAMRGSAERSAALTSVSGSGGGTATGDVAGTPCGRADPDLWFAEHPADLDRAKRLCAGCPIRSACLADALLRREPWGVWGGEIVVDGRVLAYKRGRGRPSRRDRELDLVTRTAAGERLRGMRHTDRPTGQASGNAGHPAAGLTTPGTAGTCHSRSA
jgi:WhiB family transcriptional regulator, redox-sensing transcriptional regulator